ncbi:MAG: nickel pincer cofactor biosynthesis protein LarC [Sphaerobacter sp.]|nr:nickel pincer cofactor biosynthesis protein LarC [Sphaerobacter sp.]
MTPDPAAGAAPTAGARVAYFDPYSGASGDMTLGALVDAGVALDDLRHSLAGLPVGGYELVAERVAQHGVTGTRVRVRLDPEAPQAARHWRDIRALLLRADLAEPVRQRALAIFAALAEAEGRVHGVDPEAVHFHEVGALDAIVDIVGAAAGIALLGVEAVYCGPLSLGHGFVRAAHGLLPVPAPATAALLAAARAPTRQLDIEAELVTPTGAAILTQLARFERPSLRPERVGYGFGRRELPWPNALRLWVGELDAGAARLTEGPDELLLETNIDDMSPQFFEPLIERLFAAGALDVYLTPIIMKRGRPATKLSVICQASVRGEIERVLIEQSTTLGVRALPLDRTKVGRRVETVVTRWGDVRVKLKIWRGRVIDVMPEYADCLAIARRTELPIRLIHGEALRIAEAYVGQRMEGEGSWRG